MDIFILQPHIVPDLQSLWISSFLIKLLLHHFLCCFHKLCSLFPASLQACKESFQFWGLCLCHNVALPWVSSKVKFKQCPSRYHMFFVIILEFCSCQSFYPIVLLVIDTILQKCSYFLIYSLYLSIYLRIICVKFTNGRLSFSLFYFSFFILFLIYFYIFYFQNNQGQD